MTISAPSLPPSSAAPEAKGALAPGKTDAIAPQTSFSAALESQWPGGSNAAPETGEVSAHAAERGEKAGQDSPTGGKDLPLAPGAETSAASVTALPVAADAMVLPNPNGAPMPVSSSEAVVLANAGAGIVNPVKTPWLFSETAADNESAHPAEQEGEALAEADVFRAAVQAGNQSSFTSSPDSRSGLNTDPVSNSPKAGTGINPAGVTAGADDPLSAMLEEIMPAREATPAANGQGISSTISATAGEGAAPAPQQVLAQPFTDLMASSRAVTSHGAPAASAPLAVPFNQPGWDQALGERVRWLVTQRLQAAEIHLNPPDLGPVEVRLALERDQASVQFLSPHASVREAIEAAMPRLRELLGESGIQLAGVNVGQHSAERQAPLHPDFGASRHAWKAFAPGDRDGDEAILAFMTSPISPRGLVDYYA